MLRRNIFLWLAVVAAGGMMLRTHDIATHPLWQDEAESAIYALQILDVGYPHDTFRGERLYETRSFLLDDDPKYAYQSTNFIGSKYEKNKGWLPYYLIAGSFRLFGVGDWQARLPAVLISGLTILAVYWLARSALSPPASLVAALIHAGNYFAIIHERQARYYGLVMLLSALAFASWGRLRPRGQTRWLWAAAGCWVLLFHTHAPAAVFFSLVFFLDGWRAFSHWPWATRWNAVTVAAAATALTVPWLVVVHAAAVWRYRSVDPLGFRPQWLALMVIAASVAVVLGGLWRRLGGRWRSLPPLLPWLLAVSAGYVVVVPLAVPADSVAERLFLPLLPFFPVIAVALIMRLKSPRMSADWLAAGTFVVAVVGGLGVLHANSLRRAAPYAVDWIAPVAEQLDTAERPSLVLSDYHQFSLAFATGLPTQLLSVLRCEYLRRFPDSIAYVRRPIATVGGPIVALPYCDPGDAACIARVDEHLTCLTADRACQRRTIAGTELLSCGAPATL